MLSKEKIKNTKHRGNKIKGRLSHHHHRHQVGRDW